VGISGGIWNVVSCCGALVNVGGAKPWTEEQFLIWADAQQGRYEFDGFQPVAMTGGNARHSRIIVNTHVALRSRLRGTPCSSFGPDLGVRTTGGAIRNPDVLVTCTRFPETERVAPDVRVVFEVLSPDSGRRDRIEKVREYAAVPSIRHYVIVETGGVGLLVMHRQRGEDVWTVLPLTRDDTLTLPEIGVEIPVTEIYEGVEFGAVGADR
jgi:Uma2 family endonuclease